MESFLLFAIKTVVRSGLYYGLVNSHEGKTSRLTNYGENV